MNIKRGLFRLWVIFTVIFAVSIFLFCFNSLHDEFENAYYAPWKTDTLILPVDCKDARGISGKDYTPSPTWAHDNTCEYELPKFRALYPEYKDLTDDELTEKFYPKVGMEIKHFHPWMLLLKTLIFAIGIPLMVLALGKSLFWVMAGFHNKNDG